MVATFFLQQTTAFILFLIVPSLQISCFRKTKEIRLNTRFAARLIWQLVIHSCVIFAYIISGRDGENNGFLAGVSLPPSLLARPSRPKPPFPSLSNACHAGYTIVNTWNQLTHKITRWLTDLNCICTLFVNVTITFILGSSVIIIQMAKTSIFWPFLFWSIHHILSYPNRYFAMNKLYKAVAVL